MDSAQLKSYLQFLLWHYRVVDAFWFIYTEEQFGRDAVENINEKVLGKAAELAARDIKKRFNKLFFNLTLNIIVAIAKKIQIVSGEINLCSIGAIKLPENTTHTDIKKTTRYCFLMFFE